eukprot:TRINITY_DN12604_c1_g1_i7.p1 TRINITY_DN12604_c1_g1~~TRINITY_DN12604_c1_g1_i7.p1  ORF type:complete len:102 (+),score=6.96 TRINITY_DN12604_c1_g1_i7:371-676(+)
MSMQAEEQRIRTLIHSWLIILFAQAVKFAVPVMVLKIKQKKRGRAAGGRVGRYRDDYTHLLLRKLLKKKKKKKKKVELKRSTSNLRGGFQKVNLWYSSSRI